MDLQLTTDRKQIHQLFSGNVVWMGCEGRGNRNLQYMKIKDDLVYVAFKGINCLVSQEVTS